MPRQLIYEETGLLWFLVLEVAVQVGAVPRLPTSGESIHGTGSDLVRVSVAIERNQLFVYLFVCFFVWLVFFALKRRY